MATVQTGAPAGARSVDGAINTLRTRGLRLSAARRSVLEALYAAERPVSADELAGGLGGRVRRADIGSVYRNLETLERLGLVRHVHFGHARGLYQPAAANTHEYLLCERCGELTEIDSTRLGGVRAALRAAAGFEPRFSHFPAAGVCAACAQSGA